MEVFLQVRGEGILAVGVVLFVQVFQGVYLLYFLVDELIGGKDAVAVRETAQDVTLLVFLDIVIDTKYEQGTLLLRETIDNLTRLHILEVHIVDIVHKHTYSTEGGDQVLLNERAVLHLESQFGSGVHTRGALSYGFCRSRGSRPSCSLGLLNSAQVHLLRTKGFKFEN